MITSSVSNNEAFFNCLENEFSSSVKPITGNKSFCVFNSKGLVLLVK